MFITFEGCEASGKSTQAAILRDYFIYEGRKVFFTKEPGGTALAEQLREIILKSEIKDVLTEFLLLSAARRDHVMKIRKKLEEGCVVISDRFYDSSVVIQGLAKNLDEDFVLGVTKHLLDGVSPDVTFVLDVSVDTLRERLEVSSRKRNFYDEKEPDFHRKVKEGFLSIAKKDPKRIVVVDADQDVYSIAAQIKNFLEAYC
jgi:dTMP kinase